ncbi:hypothetical protein NEMBOFW57_009796 [Staphylotrichum longicolle]|uniref:Uncharacterized protein n=1 Tax=Staphylotrichum longicolle TaxID=669026 RepID=A0AAD4EPZ8_9PEZI|nr:hypothetical protein NEMBOFW57_009796 [Staphylotrichum longicolle]
MSAQVACLSTIMEHESEEDIEEAHATYIRLASNGVPGLVSTRFSHPQTSLPMPDSVERNASPKLAVPNEKQNQKDLWEAYFDTGADTMENRIIRAMRAADELDKETEFLQPVTPDVDLTVKLVDIPSRSKKRLSSTAVEEPESLRCSKPPTPRDGEAGLPVKQVPRVSPVALLAEEQASAASRKPALKLHIPSRSAPWAGDAAANSDRHTSDTAYCPRHAAPQVSHRRRSHTAESNLSPTQKSAGEEATRKDLPGLFSATEDNDAPFEPVLPLMEDLVVFFTPETPNELHNFVFRRLSEGFRTPRQSISGLVTQRHDSLFSAETSCLSMEDGDELDQPQSEDDHVNDSAAHWAHKDLIHGLPTPSRSPNPMDASSVVMPRVDARLYSISVGEETAASIQNFLRSFLGSQFPLQDRKYSTYDGVELAEPGLWRPLECDGQVVSPDGEPRLDLILAVGAESGVKKNRLSEIVGQIDQLGFKTSGLSRSGRLDIRFLIANAMQAFTAQPLTKQTQSNPFVDRALLAALIIPHLETYLATHPDVRFLLIEYPSEHLPTVIALQTLIGTEMMKVVGIINSDASPPAQSLTVPETERRPSEGFRSLNRRGSRLSGTFVGPCSFSKANFLLASSASGFETAAFVAAIRESLISISDFYIPDRPLYRHPNPQHPSRKARKKTVVAAGGAAVSSERVDDEDDEEEDDDDDDVPDAEERRLMPLYLRRREDVERGRSSKALRWLGLV